MQNNRPAYRLYIDEMGNHHFPKSENDTPNRFLCLAGVIFRNPESEIIANTKKNAIIQKYWPNKPANFKLILHREEILRKSGPFVILTNPEVLNDFNTDLLALLSSTPCLYISTVLDKYAHKLKYKEAFEPYSWCLTVMMQRFTKFLKRYNTLGDIIIEARGKKEDRVTKDIYTQVYEKGCLFYKNSHYQDHLTSKQIKISLKTDNLIGLQFADLAGSAIQNKILYERKFKDNFPGTFNMSVYNCIKEKIFHDKNGDVSGLGENFLP